MRAKLLVRIVVVLIFLWTAIAPPPARAESLKADAAWIIVGVALIGAAIGVGIYYVARKGPSLKGCASANANGLLLLNEGDQQNYLLIGDIAGIKAGDRVYVSGKKKKKDASVTRTFVVEKLSKDYGPCKLLAATP